MISITVPIYNEEANIPQLHREITTTMERLGRPYEIILVNDGSTDRSGTMLDELAAADEHVQAIHFKRNFGQTAAMMAGFDHARGDIIVPMDGDLQNDPADIPLLLEQLDQGYDLCSGWRKDRKDPLLARRAVSRAANFLISRVSGVRLHDYGCSLKAYRRDIIENVKLYGEMHRFIPIYAGWEGARITEIPVNHRARVAGKSNYGLERTVKVLLDLMVVAFMDRFLGKPIYLFGGMGFINFFIAFLAVAVAVYFKLSGQKSLIETPLPLLAVMTFVTGTICILMGLLAEMLIRVYFQTHGKRIYVLREKRKE
ncbi:MAG: glycosyltransferase family 2 protein [Acidobacteriota bacterium]|nr:glycosyltransferase family 2 protein [Acidobacteriota bacterium]